jgi:hypothetical protein
MTITLESVFNDTSYDLELEKIKGKIQKLYMDLVEKTYKSLNPNATSEQLQSFQEANALEFKQSNDFGEEAEGLEKILDLLVNDENLDKVTDQSYEKPDVEKGGTKVKGKDSFFKAITKAIEMPKGGLFDHLDSRKKTSTKALKTPRGSIARLIKDQPKVDTRSLQDIWDEEREKLLELVRKRNKEHGVRFWE